MNIPNKSQIFQLFRSCIRYSDQLKLSDKKLVSRRIKEGTKFSLQEKVALAEKYQNMAQKFTMLVQSLERLVYHTVYRSKHTFDHSKVPILLPEDLEEEFTRGSGPGGQAVNKTNNAVILRHKPSGLIVKCHQTRSLAKNRELAREILIQKLDQLINGEDSIEAQKTRILERKSKENTRRSEKLTELKEKWKKREGIE
uniref:Prokaryotic-type class I peptide chain release factors domain-containing protein n=1 Tax=Daphnia galeata TaxID=27404 RepID=A0A8J2RNE3_9CRUS|nr:unnamed protein product [Daphnia galeata]